MSAEFSQVSETIKAKVTEIKLAMEARSAHEMRELRETVENQSVELEAMKMKAAMSGEQTEGQKKAMEMIKARLLETFTGAGEKKRIAQLSVRILLHWHAYTNEQSGHRKLEYVAAKMHDKGLLGRVFGGWRYVATGVSKDALLQAGKELQQQTANEIVSRYEEKMKSVSLGGRGGRGGG